MQAINESHYFLDPIPNHLASGIYRVFEPLCNWEFLQWIEREDVPQRQKEELIAALVDFDDGCGDFYRIRAYFVAAAGIGKFSDSRLADAIVRQIVRWEFGCFDEEERDWARFAKIIARKAREILRQTDLERATRAIADLIESSTDEATRLQAAYDLGQIGTGNETAIEALIGVL